MTVVVRPPDADLAPDVITTRSRSNFLAGFSCMDEGRRAAMTAIYAYCRVVDDAVDDAPDVVTATAYLEFWRDELCAAERSSAQTPVGRALQAAMDDYEIPAQHFHDLIAGCATDIDPSGIADEEELDLYCYRVAAAVGLACLPVFGAHGDDAQRYGVALGHALQCTNVLRDLHADAHEGRCYVPRTWLDECGVAIEDLLGNGDQSVYVADGPMARLRSRFVNKARSYFKQAHELLRAMPTAKRRALVPARIMGAIYGSLLRTLAARGGTIDGPRAAVPKWRKVLLALSVFAGVRR